jgi:uncharacterized protein (DUF58 family)
MPHRRNNIYVIIIGSLILGLLTGRALFFNIAYVLFGLFFISMIWAWIAIWGVTLGRQTRSLRSQVGRTFTEVFRVRNTTFLPKLYLEVRDYSDLPFHQVSQIIPPLGARNKFEWRVDTACVVRGEFKLGPMSVTTGDPFGLFHPHRTINASERMIVYPQMLPIDRFGLPVGVLSGGEAQRYITQNVTTNAAGVRDYVQGDSINRIHWKSTARRNKLIVKEFELDPQVDIWLFVDFSAQSLVEARNVERLGQIGTVIPNNGAIPQSTEEYGVVIGASLANYFTEQERTLGFMAFVPHREVYYPERGNRQLTRILETLAIARSFAQNSVHEMLATEAHSFTRGTTLVVITASLDTRWLVEAQKLAQRGVKPVCIYIEPASFGGIYASDDIRAKLQHLKIPSLVVRYGDDLSLALSQRPL